MQQHIGEMQTYAGQALRAQWGVDDDTLVVLHVGRLAPEKNPGVVMQAFDRIRNIHPRARLLLVGDGPSRAELQARHPEAMFAGFRAGEDLAAHYASSDMFLFPSLTETYGNVTPEAMGLAARTKVADLGWDSILGKIECIYAGTMRRVDAPVVWSPAGSARQGSRAQTGIARR